MNNILPKITTFTKYNGKQALYVHRVDTNIILLIGLGFEKYHLPHSNPSIRCIRPLLDC